MCREHLTFGTFKERIEENSCHFTKRYFLNTIAYVPLSSLETPKSHVTSNSKLPLANERIATHSSSAA
jgi:hypothetical protein